VSKTKNFLPAFSDTKIRQAMKDAGSHVKTAATALGVDFSSLYARLKTMRENGSPVITAAAAALAKKKSAKKKAAAAKKAPARRRPPPPRRKRRSGRRPPPPRRKRRSGRRPPRP